MSYESSGIEFYSMQLSLLQRSGIVADSLGLLKLLAYCKINCMVTIDSDGTGY